MHDEFNGASGTDPAVIIVPVAKAGIREAGIRETCSSIVQAHGSNNGVHIVRWCLFKLLLLLLLLNAIRLFLFMLIMLYSQFRTPEFWKKL